MKKVIIIGSCGSGKSTFARALAEKTGIPLYHLDMLYWNADRTTADREVFRERLDAVLSLDTWIIDGNYASTMEHRMEKCDTVFFLDMPPDICLEGIAARRGKPRPDMPWVENEADEEFLNFVKNFSLEQRPKIIALLEKYNAKTVITFKNREEIAEYLENLQKT